MKSAKIERKHKQALKRINKIILSLMISTERRRSNYLQKKEK